ncbi:DUF1559 domain-containing protein [Roseiconus nitratireducens]|uniref:DUF1559 domain-containing protein n=1 Tax=Roseiconus nitratireducens TaxID=2605748 RepID=A0A5M6D909_9BACT|nr:DUF1559 domain-containing protein [Roseiconus nitratireducens]KAA5543843.1 DUF1559 domain-containing protein [Roseiconus nitratireducens]
MIPRYLILPIVVLGLVGSAADAQESVKLSAKHIPDSAVAAAYLSPREVLTSPEWELMPVEILQAAAKESVGIDPLHIQDVKVVVGLPGPGGPQFGALLSFTQDYPIDQLNPELLKEFQRQDVDGLSVYQSPSPPLIQIHQPNPRSLLIAGGDYLLPVLNADGTGQGQLVTLVPQISRRSGLTVVVAMDQIRPMVTGGLRQLAPRIPPPIQPLTEIAEMTDALMVNVNYGMMTGAISVSALARDAGAAENLEADLNAAIDYGVQSFKDQLIQNANDEGPVFDATVQYVDRISKKLSEFVRPQRNDRVVRIDVDTGKSNVAMTGVMVGLLLPAVQAAREAARRMTASNGLKQIGLAMHNHHSAYKHFPDRAIRDEEGKPLLSWRVKLLPFLDQQALYEQFHLDEPWDSPHNRALIEKMPTVYQDPSAVVPAGQTVFQLPIGPGLMFEEQPGERTIRDITDGTSMTIMAVESSADAAVPWTKPEDLSIDMQQPMAEMGGSHPGGFHVLMGDGAVRFIADSIDPALFKAMLTRAGGEPINF